MKILRYLLVLALSVFGGLGCEMHTTPEHAGNSDQNTPNSTKPLQPEAANPNPPSFFPTPKSG